MARAAKVLRRLCIRDWSVTAESGDHFEVKVGELYATSAAVKDGKVTVFSTYWVPVPAECFTSEGIRVA